MSLFLRNKYYSLWCKHMTTTYPQTSQKKCTQVNITSIFNKWWMYMKDTLFCTILPTFLYIFISKLKKKKGGKKTGKEHWQLLRVTYKAEQRNWWKFEGTDLGRVLAIPKRPIICLEGWGFVPQAISLTFTKGKLGLKVEIKKGQMIKSIMTTTETLLNSVYWSSDEFPWLATLCITIHWYAREGYISWVSKHRIWASPDLALCVPSFGLFCFISFLLQ